jgi:hypothetical protein
VRPIPAIVEPAQIDIDKIAEQIIVAGADLAGVERSIARLTGQLETARATAEQRRLDIGRWLVKARPQWPERGPNAKGWGEFLKRVGLEQATAWRYMELAKPQDFMHAHETSEDEDDTGPRIRPIAGTGEQPPFRQLTEDDLVQSLGRLTADARKRVLDAARTNVKGGSGETARGTWCTSADWAAAVGPWEVDPFSNPRSHVAAVRRCMLEEGGNGLLDLAVPGSYSAPPTFGRADELTRVWIQPPYELVAEAIAHYGHTRFCALLRWSPDVKAWFPALWKRTAVVCHPFCERMEFEPPPGVPSSGEMPFPHALYYAHEADVTDEVRARCIVWRIDHDLDDVRSPIESQLHIVR